MEAMHVGGEKIRDQKHSIPWYSIVGFGIIIIAEILLFLNVPIISVYFTPLVWTGYIMVIDGFVYHLSGKSWFKSRKIEFALLCIFSIGFWLIFEAYNLMIQNWHYEGLPESRLLRYIGYTWSFATIYPAIFATRDLLIAHKCCIWCRHLRIIISTPWLVIMSFIGFLFLIIPLISPSPYHAPLIWTGFVFFLEPINYWGRGQSLIRELSRGYWQNFWALFIAGIICGILWEFWNFWAVAKWIYMVPYLPTIKIFEMPLIGYFGFPAFALECFVMYSALAMVLRRMGIPPYGKDMEGEIPSI